MINGEADVIEHGETMVLEEPTVIATRVDSETISASSVAQAEETGPDCTLCDASETGFVYALGRVEVHFPTLGVEKEIAQATARSHTSGATDGEVLSNVLSDVVNRHLVRQLCWVFRVAGVQTYILQPRYAEDFDMLIQAIRPVPRPTDIDVVIGTQGPLSSPDQCGGFALPTVVFDQIYSFDVSTFVQAVSQNDEQAGEYGVGPEKSTAMAEQLFYSVLRLSENHGSSAEQRAVNYLTVRYEEIYKQAVARSVQDFSLSGVETRTSRISGARKIVDVIFVYSNRRTGLTEKLSARVDVTDEYPFLDAPLSPYYEWRSTV